MQSGHEDQRCGRDRPLADYCVALCPAPRKLAAALFHLSRATSLCWLGALRTAPLESGDLSGLQRTVRELSRTDQLSAANWMVQGERGERRC